MCAANLGQIAPCVQSESGKQINNSFCRALLTHCGKYEDGFFFRLK